jgi:hypothetical protein
MANTFDALGPDAPEGVQSSGLADVFARSGVDQLAPVEMLRIDIVKYVPGAHGCVFLA